MNKATLKRLLVLTLVAIVWPLAFIGVMIPEPLDSFFSFVRFGFAAFAMWRMADFYAEHYWFPLNGDKAYVMVRKATLGRLLTRKRNHKTDPFWFQETRLPLDPAYKRYRDLCISNPKAAKEFVRLLAKEDLKRFLHAHATKGVANGWKRLGDFKKD